jgi:hypothetical protein
LDHSYCDAVLIGLPNHVEVSHNMTKVVPNESTSCTQGYLDVGNYLGGGGREVSVSRFF